LKRDATGSYIWGFHDETPSERKLSAVMRKAGLKFGQEIPVKGFTVDFLLGEWLVVEVDGESHLISGRAEKDASRQEALEAAGFTVLRVPAFDLSSDSGLKRWVTRIKEKVHAGPPYQRRQTFTNEDYKRQMDQVKKALHAGEVERQKREAMAFRRPDSPVDGDGARGAAVDKRSTGPALHEETMEDYFGKKGQDFTSMLRGYDWTELPEKQEEGGDAPRRSRSRRNGGSGSPGARGAGPPHHRPR